MNGDEPVSPARELTVAEAASRELPGQQLRRARESLGYSVADVAQSIKFSPRQIEALERGDYEVLPSGQTFIRGFIRSYAKLMRIDAGPLLDALPREVPVEPAELERPQDLGTRLPVAGSGLGWMPMAALGALGLAVAALAVHYFYRGEAKAPPSRKSPVAAAESAPAVNPPPAALPAPSVPAQTPEAAVARPATAAPAAADAVARPAPAASGAAPASPVAAVAPKIQPPTTVSRGSAAGDASRHRHQLIFMFDQDSWVEVKDGEQHIIFSQVNPAGTRQIVNGSPPFDLVIGNASGVHVQYDGHAIDLTPDTRAEVARLTLQ